MPQSDHQATQATPPTHDDTPSAPTSPERGRGVVTLLAGEGLPLTLGLILGALGVVLAVAAAGTPDLSAERWFASAILFTAAVPIVGALSEIAQAARR